ncbi:MAG: ROK family protein [Clostridia bacterium]|nr:ROK family protein [Clostridia bacterium]
MSLYMGLDIGGTTIKGIVMDEMGNVSAEDSIPTECGEKLADCCIEIADRLLCAAGKVSSDLAAVGVDCPGMIDSQHGKVVFAGNLQLKDYPLAKLIRQKLGGVKVRICNDANAAALGEARFGAGKGYRNSVLVTLGTGIGGGIVIDGKLFEGFKSAGAEIGHMVIEKDGIPCTCGRKGCFERYASARALEIKTRQVMADDTATAMWKTYTEKTATAKTPFEYMDTDETARKIVDWYLNNLACGCVNLANIFRPEVIMIGGGVAAQGSRLIDPLQKLVDAELFGGGDYAPVKVCVASLGPKAGEYGAIALALR